MMAACLCLVAVAVGGCGRRGKLEPPSGATREPAGATTGLASPRALPLGTGEPSGVAGGADAVRDGDELPTTATPAGGENSAPVQTGRGAKRGYTIPKDPFILDAIL